MTSRKEQIEQRIVAFLASTGPVSVTPSTGWRGTADSVVGKGIGYRGQIALRQHIRTAIRKGLIHGDVNNYLAAGPGVGTWAAKRRGRKSPVQAAVKPSRADGQGAATDDEAELEALLSTARGAIDELRRTPALDRLSRGLPVAQILDMMTRVAVAEPDYAYGERVTADHDPGLGADHLLVVEPNPDNTIGLQSEEAKRAVTFMYLRGFEPDEIGLALNLPVDRVVRHLRRQHNHRQAREVVKLSLDGVPAVEVARRTGVARSSVYEILGRAGCSPPTGWAPAKVRDKALRLRRAGASYGEIKNATGLSTNQLRKLFQRRKASIPGYGQPQGPRRPSGAAGSP